MEISKLIEVVEHYAKNKSYHSIDSNDRMFIIKLHDELIPMDRPLFKDGAGGCDACIRKAMSRFVQHYDTLLQYRDDRKPKEATALPKPKNKGGRPRKRK